MEIDSFVWLQQTKRVSVAVWARFALEQACRVSGDDVLQSTLYAIPHQPPNRYLFETLTHQGPPLRVSPQKPHLTVDF